MFCFSEYADWSRDNRDGVRTLCEQQNVHLAEHQLSFASAAESWKVVCSVIDPDVLQSKAYTIDISTMPRETIWTVLWRLSLSGAVVKCIYHSPQQYGAWLSRDPDKPRLVFKLSGVARLGIGTKLLIVTGFDTDRVDQLIQHFEPEETVLGLQPGGQYESTARNVDKYKAIYGGKSDVRLFDVNAFSGDLGYSVIAEQVAKIVEGSNVILASLGPKLSALSLFRIHRRWDQTGLVYAPSREFNRKYSTGIGESIQFQLPMD